MSDDMEQLTRDEAKALIDETDSGILTCLTARTVPALGDVDPADRQVKIETEMYRFGDTTEDNTDD